MSSDSSIMSGLPDILGGVPTKHQDFIPSIVAAGLFAAIFPLAIWRLSSPTSTKRVLIRPTIFAGLQVAAYIIRAIIADGHQNQALYITSQVLLLAGFILVCEPIIFLLNRVVGKYQKGVEHPHQTQQRILRLLRILLITALICGIAASSLISEDTSAGVRATMKDLRIANAILVIIAMAGSMFVATFFFIGDMTPKASLLVALQGLCLLASASYKLYNALRGEPPLATSTKIEFYVFCALLQWIAVLGYFLVNLEVAFPDSSKANYEEQYDDYNRYSPSYNSAFSASPMKETV